MSHTLILIYAKDIYTIYKEKWKERDGERGKTETETETVKEAHKTKRDKKESER